MNQKLAVRILEKWGHTVAVAGNGHDALAALEREPFDLVLMDLQMPDMGGLEATAALRAREAQTGGHLPVIAMTAHAMKGDRERCLEAGMDGYVSKPIQPADLFDAIEQTVAALAGNGPAPQPPDVVAPAKELPVLDYDTLMERVQGDRELLGELVDLFLAAYPRQLAELRTAVEREDSPAIYAVTHSLKGSVSNFAAGRALETILKMEEAGRSADSTDAGRLLGDLEGDMAGLGAALSALKA